MSQLGDRVQLKPHDKISQTMNSENSLGWRLLLPYVIAVWQLAGLATCSAATAEDHLVPRNPKAEEELGATYRKLYEEKLFVTPGEISRYVHLPGPIAEPETVLAVYRKPGRDKTLPAEYWVTVTQPSRRIWDLVEASQTERSNQQNLSVKRWDAQLPEAIALAIRDVWLRMLNHSGPDSCPECFSDNTTEIFSAVDSNGKQLRAELPKKPGKQTLAFLRLADLLVDYTNGPSERLRITRKIKSEIAQLQRTAGQRPK
jgi:hypothetical protein